MSWLPSLAPGATPLDRVFGLCPAAYARWRELDARLWEPGVIDAGLLELCRLRIATLLRCDAERALRHRAAIETGLSEAQVDELPRWPTSPRFAPVHRACLAFAEQYVLDPHGVTDAHFEALRAHLAPPAVATLVLAIAVFEALARFRLALGVGPAALT